MAAWRDRIVIQIKAPPLEALTMRHRRVKMQRIKSICQNVRRAACETAAISWQVVCAIVDLFIPDDGTITGRPK